MGIYKFDLIPPNAFKPSGRHFSNNDIVNFVPINYFYDDYRPPVVPNPVAYQNNVVDNRNNNVSDNQDNIHNEQDLDSLFKDEITLNNELQDHKPYQDNEQNNIYDTPTSTNDIGTEPPKNRFKYNLITLKENCTYFTNIINRGSLYQAMSNGVTKEELNTLLSELINILWNIYTSTEEILNILSNISPQESKNFKLKKFRIDQINAIWNISNELLLIIQKALELPDITEDEKEFIINKMLLLKKAIEE